MSRKPKLAEVPPLDFGPSAPEGIRLTKEIRAELMRLTGQEVTEDDPILTLVYLEQLLLGNLADEIAVKLAKANEAVAAQLAEMRQETLDSVAAELGSIDFTEAAGRADRIVHGIERGIRMHKGFWFLMGVVACALLGLGILVGRVI